eukprot:scaffold55717_cov65-Phaeocystis_antarctica.AAC.1
MSALSLALRQSACQSERNGSGPPKRWLHVPWRKGYSEAGVLTHRATRLQPQGAALMHLPHVHPRQRLLDRVEADGCQHRPLTGLLLLRAHHHVERCAADLGVVDFLDAVGALERLRVVPRLQQQHRVPNGADA